MTDEPQEPVAPPGMRPHSERIAEIVRLCPTNGKTAGVAIDNDQKYIDYYKHQFAKRPEIRIVKEGRLTSEIYVIAITKTHLN